MPEAAADVYEIVLESTDHGVSVMHAVESFVRRLLRLNTIEPAAEGAILSVVRIGDGVEVFRHVEDLADDDHLMIDDINRDLATMTVAEFKAVWVD